MNTTESTNTNTFKISRSVNQDFSSTVICLIEDVSLTEDVSNLKP